MALVLHQNDHALYIVFAICHLAIYTQSRALFWKYTTNMSL